MKRTSRGNQPTSAALVLLLAALLLSVAGCDDSEPQDAPWTPPVMPIEPTEGLPERPPADPSLQYDPAAEYEAVVATSLGTFRLGFYPEETPKTVERFIMLAQNSRLYNGQIFYRVIKDTLVQTGDPESTGAGVPEGPGPIVGEFTQRQFVPGTVGFARREDNPNSGDMQWFICLRRESRWDGKFAAFGYVKEGLDVVRKISQVEVEGQRAVHWTRREQPVDPPRILSVQIVKLSGGASAAQSAEATDNPRSEH